MHDGGTKGNMYIYTEGRLYDWQYVGHIVILLRIYNQPNVFRKMVDTKQMGAIWIAEDAAACL